MAGYTPHGTIFKRNAVNVAQVSSFTPPAWSRETLEVLHHESTNGYAEKISSGVRRIEPFDVTVIWDPTQATHDGVVTDFGSDTIQNYSIVYTDGDTWAFSAFVTNIALGDVPADPSDPQEATITFDPSGSVTVT